jgi:hypothetical protein
VVKKQQRTIVCGLVLGCVACARVVEHPASSEILQPRITDDQIVAHCGEGERNEIRIGSDVDPGAPIIVLEEVHLHGWGSPQPTVAIWPNGRILFAHPIGMDGDRIKYEQLEATIPKTRVDTLVQETASALVTVPRYKSIYVNFGMDGGQLTTIVVRDGRQWRSATVYGAHEDDFLAAAAAAGTLPRKALDPDLPGMTETLYEDPPPKPFALAYRTLLATRPAAGHAYVPYDYGLVLFAPSQYDLRQHPSQVIWPDELPKPPRSLSPGQCDQYDTDGCRYLLDAKYDGAAKRFYGALHATKVWPLVHVRDKQFMVRLDDFYRGERSIHALIRCTEYFSRDPYAI